MKFNKLNIGVIKAELMDKNNTIGDFERVDVQGEVYNYAKVTQVWTPKTPEEKELYRHKILHLNQAPMLVKVGDIIRVPTHRDVNFENDGTRYVLVHQRDILEWHRPESDAARKTNEYVVKKEL